MTNKQIFTKMQWLSASIVYDQKCLGTGVLEVTNCKLLLDLSS
ncbi:MAG: hypothetical protein PF694_11230 [Bacteroidetes bacterium]|nr:hypothetical protein [Bacteroidota bacterium]